MAFSRLSVSLGSRTGCAKVLGTWLRSYFGLRNKDVLLSEIDLMARDDRYLRKIDPEEYSEMDDSLCIPILQHGGSYRRICTIIPLFLKSLSVIPVPCLIDTGAPAFMLFGSESSKLVGEIAKMLKCGG